MAAGLICQMWRVVGYVRRGHQEDASDEGIRKMRQMSVSDECVKRMRQENAHDECVRPQCIRQMDERQMCEMDIER